MNYELSTFDDSIFMSVPVSNFRGQVTHSPNGRYFAAGNNHMVALIDTDHDHLMYVYDIFHRVDNDQILITNHPLIVIRDIVSLGLNRQNDIYVLNHRADVLFKVSVNANIYKMAISDNGEFIAAQTLDNNIRLFSVDDMQEIAIWKTPKKLAIDLIIDLKTNEVRMLDHQNHVYSYRFKTV